MSETHRRDRGFALLIVLWTVVLLAFLVTQIMSNGRSEAQIAFNLRSGATAQAAADGAVYDAIFHLLDKSAGHWPADGKPHMIQLPQATVEARIVSEAGKIDPNTASPALLQALLRNCGADAVTAQSVAASIVNWRFPDAQGQPLGAQAKDYQTAGRNYGPPSAPFEKLSDLGLVLGMTPSLLTQLEPHLTVFRSRPIDPGAADPVVLKSLRDIGQTLAEPPAATQDEGVVRIDASARTAQGSQFARQAVVRLGAGAGRSIYQILQWASN